MFKFLENIWCTLSIFFKFHRELLNFLYASTCIWLNWSYNIPRLYRDPCIQICTWIFEKFNIAIFFSPFLFLLHFHRHAFVFYVVFVFQPVIQYPSTHLAQKIGTARNANRGTTISVPKKISCRDGVTHVTIILLRGTLFGEHDSRSTIQGLRKRLSYKTIPRH